MKKLILFLIGSLIFFLNINSVKATEQVIEDGIYVIHSSIDYNYVIDVNEGNAANGSNIQLFQNNNGLAQKFMIKNAQDGFYEIKTVLDENFSLDINEGIFSNFTNIQLWKNNGSKAQRWKIEKEINDSYRICTENGKYCININNSITTNSSNIELYQVNNTNSQRFKLEKIVELKKSIEDGLYTISTGSDDNMMIDIYGGLFKNYTNIQLFEKNNGYSQKFYINYLGNGYYSIRPYSNMNYSLDVNGGSKKVGANVQLFTYKGYNSQKWIINVTNDGYYNIVSKCNYLNLDVYGGFSKNETNIQLYNNNGAKNQKFKFNKLGTASSKSIEDGYYFINTIKNAKKVVDIWNANMINGTNVQIFDLNYSLAQKWYIKYLDNGYYSILCDKDNDYSLQVDDSNVNIGKFEEKDNQLWAIEKVNNGYYIISKTGKYFDLTEGKTDNENNIEVFSFNGSDAQKFNFIKTASGISEKVIEDGIYRIASALDNNMFVDVYGAKNANGTNVQLWNGHSGISQKFMVKYMSNGYYKISTLVDLNKVIDVEYSSDRNGTNISIFDDSQTINQQWIIKYTGNGYYSLISNCNGLYLDVYDSNNSNGTNIQLWEKNNSKNQKFKFIKSSKETKIIDVSYHQGEIDWDKVANSGIYGVILRIGYYRTEDERFSEYIKEVKRLGIPYGIYLYSYSSTTNGANIEADLTKNMISKYDLNPTLGIYYDIEHWSTSSEDSYNISKSQYDNIIGTYINNVSSYVGAKYKVKVYTYTNYANNYLGDYARSQIDWIADYRSTCGYKGNYSLWQYTSEATLDGIRGFVDMSYLY